jgi:EAL domain-containing protein (putative c-di-GMP-specific phosphodiesterase class I)
MLEELSVLLCEGVKTAQALNDLRDLGVSLIQRFVLAKPRFEALAVTVEPATLLTKAA